jgi:hypothetical protein
MQSKINNILSYNAQILKLAERVKLYKVAIIRDINNKINYGKNAPRFAEKIYVNPLDCKKAVDESALKNELNVSSSRMASGKIIETSKPFEESFPVKKIKKIQFCIEHWEKDLSWKEVGAYDYMKKIIQANEKPVDGCFDMKDIINRYQKLDKIFNQIKREGELKPVQELDDFYFREFGGIYVHIGPDREPYLGMGGLHRFAIAMILELDEIPAQVGVVHKDALDIIPDLRNKNGY